MKTVQIAPTLQTMADVYALSCEGGPKSERFAAYVSRVPSEWGLVPYNPMAGAAALETVQELIAMRAEALAHETAERVAAECSYDDALTLAIAVRSKGMWTDRVATEVAERVTGQPRTLHRGIVSIWSREACSAQDVTRETAAEAVRVMWHALHGVPDTLSRVLACEGLAYAMAEPLAAPGDYGAAITPEDSVAVVEAFDVLGDTRQGGEIAAVLYGDDVAVQLGWTPLGIAKLGGYRWATARARANMLLQGASRTLRCDVPG